MSWLRDSRGQTNNLKGVDFARGQRYLSDILSWRNLQSGIVCFSPTRDMATQSMAKRRHFGSFCVALLYNFPTLLYRAIEPSALIATAPAVHLSHDWLLHHDGTMISHFDTGMNCGVQPVSSMSDCDAAAATDSGTPVHFGAHPALTRVVQFWAGRRRWRPQRRKLKLTICQHRRAVGTRILSERGAKEDFQLISEGLPLITWRGIQQIRGSFPTNAQTLYRLKSNSFHLWNWAKMISRAPYQSVWLQVLRRQAMYSGPALAHVATGHISLNGGGGSALLRRPT